MFKFNNKITRMTSMTRFSSVSIVEFEQVNVSWDFSEKPDLLPNNQEVPATLFDII